MKPGHAQAIALEYMPNPEGDNRLDVDIREGMTRVTYWSSTHAEGGARDVRVTFIECFAVRYSATEEHEALCPGLGECEAGFAEVLDSPWLLALPSYVQMLKHYVFGLNHCFFECIAGGYRVDPEPTAASD